MPTQEETDAINAFTGFSLNQILDGMAIPASSALSQLGISSGLSGLNGLYRQGDDDEAVGLDQGEDWEAQIDKEMEEEEEEDAIVKVEPMSPSTSQSKQRRVRVVKRLVERPKTVYERFPTFEKDKVLDFSELFKGYTVRKPRISRRPYNGE